MGDREVDQLLVERAQRGEKAAFRAARRQISAQARAAVVRFIRDPTEVEDVAQEAFIKAYRALPSFRGDSAFYTWLYRIGINTAKNSLVALGRRAPTVTETEGPDGEGSEDSGQVPDYNTPENELMSRQIAETVNKAVDDLPEELRTAITLRELEGLSENRGIMNCPIGTVRSPDLPGSRGDCREASSPVGDAQRQEMVRWNGSRP